jgi:hypothetical protein
MAVERGPAKSFGMPRLTARGWGYEYAHAWDQYVVAPCECDQGRAHRFRIDLARDAGLAGIEGDGMRMIPTGGRPILKQGVCFRRTHDPCGEAHSDKKRDWLLKAGAIHGLNLLSTM